MIIVNGYLHGHYVSLRRWGMIVQKHYSGNHASKCFPNREKYFKFYWRRWNLEFIVVVYVASNATNMVNAVAHSGRKCICSTAFVLHSAYKMVWNWPLYIPLYWEKCLTWWSIPHEQTSPTKHKLKWEFLQIHWLRWFQHIWIPNLEC